MPPRPPHPFVVFLHATSRADKRWPEPHWVALGQRFHDRGIDVVLPWGNAAEKRTSERLASAIPASRVPPAMSLVEAAALLSRASGTIGVDTGLAHLSVALARPTVGLYLTTSPALTGLYSSEVAVDSGSSLAINLGGGNPQHRVVPSVDAAWHALDVWLPRR